MENEHEFTDRYREMGIAYPDPATMCKGQCEGTGVYPQFLAGPWLKPNATRLIQEENVTEEEIRRWHAAHLIADHAGDKDGDGHYTGVAECDGWHFIACPDCEGTGKAQ